MPECRCGKPVEPGSDECFLCRVRSVGFNFVGGGGYGRETFHERTTAEFINENVPEGAVPVERGVRAS
jgi:hypothetical protein